jgi:SAM-dependent methyltransferase
MPPGTAGILDRRSLTTSHRRLAALLRPGLRVLDVGCGTGAITRGIAEAVRPSGRGVGVDVNADLIARAVPAPHLSFVVADADALPFSAVFDVVTAARILQWLRDPRRALASMVAATRPGGRVLVLDYNHEKIAWVPEPPQTAQEFYGAFLRWRTDAGMDNTIADHLAGLATAVGLEDVMVTPQPEHVGRGDADFASRAGIWADVAATRGHQMVADGAVTESLRSRAEHDYRQWVRDDARSQTMYLVAVEGVRPV